MKIEVGSVVLSLRGRDKGEYFAVVGVSSDNTLCCLRDGKTHKLEHPKRKNTKHILLTQHKLQSEALQVNKHLKKAIDSLIE